MNIMFLCHLELPFMKCFQNPRCNLQEAYMYVFHTFSFPRSSQPQEVYQFICVSKISEHFIQLNCNLTTPPKVSAKKKKDHLVATEMWYVLPPDIVDTRSNLISQLISWNVAICWRTYSMFIFKAIFVQNCKIMSTNLHLSFCLIWLITKPFCLTFSSVNH